MRIDSPLMTNAIATGSFSGSFVGAFEGDITADSVAYDNITGKPTLVSGSAQVVALVEAGTDSNTFTDADHTKLNGIEASADVTDTTNVTAAGALMDSELTSITDVKALDQSVVSGASPTFGTANFTDATNKRLMTDAQETKLDSVETNADVTDATNVTAAGALMDSELAEIATVKALTAAGISGSLSAAALVALGANLISGSASDVRTFLNVEDGATGDQSNAEIRTAVEAATDSNVFTDADHTKLNGIEASADVTDTSNVTSAGALMDSEVTALALIKGLTAAQISGSGDVRFEALNAATSSYALKSGASIVSASVLSSPSQGTIRLATNGVNTDVDSGLQSGDSPTFSGLTISNNVTVNGNLSVLGDATELQVSNLRIEDKLIEVASGSADSAAADGAGLSIDGADKALTWNHANTRFNFDAALNVAGNITTSGTVDGRDVASDGTKLDGIESSATADQTAAEIRTLVESATDSNVFTDADHTKLNGIEASADVTDATNVKASLPSGVISSSAQITGVVITADSANTSRRMVFTESDDSTDTNAQLFKDSAANFFYNPSTNTLSVPNIAASGNVDGRDVSADGTKLDGIEASADVTDTTNVTAAGALMDSELTDLAAVKAINQSLVTTADVRFDSIGVNTAAPGTSGVIRAANDIVAFYSSDERLKENISNIPNALEKVESLRGVEFDWNDNQEVYEGHDIGVIAQDVEKVLPEIVENRDNGYKAVKYEKLTAVLIEAVKELSARVKELENK